MADNKVILPVRIDSYAGDVSALEVHFFKDSEEYGGKSVSDKSMWIAVPIVNGMVDHDSTDYGYVSIEELLGSYKNEKIIGLKTNRRDAELERAREIAEDAIGVLLANDKDVDLDLVPVIEGEIGLEDGAIEKAYHTLLKARKAERTKPSKIDRDEVFYSLCIEDIFLQAEELEIPRKKLTLDAIKHIINRIEGSLEDTNDKIQDAIRDELGVEKHED